MNDYDVFLKGNLVDLIAVDASLIESSNWYLWFNDEENMHHSLHHAYPNTRELQLQYYRNNIEQSDRKLQLGILHKADNVLVGMISLSDIDYFHGRCELSGMIGEKRYQNVELFVEAASLILKHAFNQLRMHKVYGGTMVKQFSDLCCRYLGFKAEGCKRQELFKNGCFHDIYLIGLLVDDYRIWGQEKKFL